MYNRFWEVSVSVGHLFPTDVSMRPMSLKEWNWFYDYYSSTTFSWDKKSQDGENILYISYVTSEGEEGVTYS
jgi:hypothetical protein